MIIPLVLLMQAAVAQEKPRQENPKPSVVAGTEQPAVHANTNGALAKWDQTSVDFGNIKIKVPVTAEFVLTNDGNEPLIISSAKASCGCTNLKYDKEPILPKKSTTLSVTYNAAVAGNFMKTITVITNASEQAVFLQIKGKVVEE